MAALRSDLDQESDVLYIYVDEPRAAITEGGPDGILLRRAIDDGAPCGVTVVRYRADWTKHRQRLARHLAGLLAVRAPDAFKVLPP